LIAVAPYTLRCPAPKRILYQLPFDSDSSPRENQGIRHFALFCLPRQIQPLSARSSISGDNAFRRRITIDFNPTPSNSAWSLGLLQGRIAECCTDAPGATANLALPGDYDIGSTGKGPASESKSLRPLTMGLPQVMAAKSILRVFSGKCQGKLVVTGLFNIG